MKMLMIGEVERYLMEKIRMNGAIHITLIDPDKREIDFIKKIMEAKIAGTTAIMIGGSVGISEKMLDELILNIKKKVELPIILFPGNVTGISKYADAIWFMSLLNSSNTYYIIDAQAQGSLIIKRYGLEAIPMGYIIVGEGGAAGYIGQARRIPYDHPEIVAMYALAGELLGMRFIYLEAGSGADKPIPVDLIRFVKKVCSVPLIVGGGIKNAEQAKTAVKAGANVIVTGTMIEQEDVINSVGSIVNAIKEVNT